MFNTEDLGSSIMTIRYKIVFVGDINVGKTAVMNRFINNTFTGEYDVINNIYKFQATIGVDFATKNIEFKNKPIKLQIWDSAGQERYKALIPSYVRGASIIFIIYDVSNKNTFMNVITWINFIKDLNKENALLVLCGNKIDLQREVSTNEGKNLAQKEKMVFFETSAKDGTGVNSMMYYCISELPFFEQFYISKDILRKELENINSNNVEVVNSEPKKQSLKIDQENSTSVIFNRKAVENEKKKCGC